MVKETVKYIIQQFYIWVSLDLLSEQHLVLLICFCTYYELIQKFLHQHQSCRAGEENQVDWFKMVPFMTVLVSQGKFVSPPNPHKIVNLVLPVAASHTKKCNVAYGSENQVTVSHTYTIRQSSTTCVWNKW